MAEMDWRRKNRRRVYRDRDEQHGPGSVPSRRRVVPVAALCRSVACFKEVMIATRFKVFALVVALAAGTSSAATAQYAVPSPGYPSNPVSGAAAGEMAGVANDAAEGGPVGAIVGGAIGTAAGGPSTGGLGGYCCAAFLALNEAFISASTLTCCVR
jgi:hypothetical protein